MNEFEDTFGEAPSRAAFEGQSFGVYPRVSSLAQAKEDKSSLDAQIEACQAYGEGMGMVLDPDCVKKEAHTASTLDRPQLKSLLQLMRERKVRNLVIDRADRLTRQGMLAAATLLTQFTQAGILLHVVSMGMVVKNEYQVMMFLQMAFVAQQANKARIQAMTRAKRKNAENGRYLRGNRPPYGFLYETLETNDKGRPTKIALAPDMRDIGGHRAWETRRRICQLYLEGNSIRRIATLLTKEGAPPSRVLFGHASATRYWDPSVVLDYLRDPLNIGVGRSFRYQSQDAPPDEAHDYAWTKRLDTPVDRQIEIPGVVSPPFLLTPDEAAQIERRLATSQRFRPATPQTVAALLRGGLARCGQITPDGVPCGGTLRVRYDHRNDTYSYVCRTHEHEPARCPGLSIPGRFLDQIAWTAVLERLLHQRGFEELAEAQAALDTSETPTSRLRQLEQTRSGLQNKRDNLFDSLSLTNDAYIRTTLMAKVEELGQMIAEADRDLEAYQRLAADWERKATILKNIQHQVVRYMTRIRNLRLDNPDDLPFFRTIFLSLGVQPIVSTDNGGYKFVVKFNLGAGTAKPWFSPDELDDGGTTLEGSSTRRLPRSVSSRWRWAR
jgi:DNA invertase Pin-like site-specific DNA recombinase